MKFIDTFLGHCWIHRWYTRRKALRVLRHARFYADRNYEAVHILIDAQFKVLRDEGKVCGQ